MSFQDVQLTPLIISELYRDLLVDIEDANAPLPRWTPRAQTSGAIETTITSPVITSDSDTEPILPKTNEKKRVPDTEPAFSSTKKANPDTNPVLLDVPVTKPASNTTPSGSNTGIKYLGGNKKRIAFIVNSATDVYLPDTQLDWLQKMLEACRLNLGDVAIANVAKNDFSISDIKQELFSNTVILLGAEPSAIQLPINFPHFNLQQHDGITFLATPPPGQLNQSTAEAKLLKSKLWVSLQKLFKL